MGELGHYLPALVAGIHRQADIAEAVAAFAIANRETLAALDLNPVIVARDGRVVAVDALIESGA